MPPIDHMLKQAKLVLKWHRGGHYPVAARIRQLLPRFRHLDDRQILDQAFKLSDAQELVARTHGFESWQALKTGLDGMTSATSRPNATLFLEIAEPQLFVTDIAASCAFFTEKLGFTVGFIYGEPPFYGQVVRDAVRLNLRHVDGPVFDAGFRGREADALSATIILADAKSLFLEFQDRGVAFHQPLRTEPWGARSFIVADPDGNLIAFTGTAG